MISLQQIQLSTFCPVGAVSLAIHRTTLTSLVVHKNYLSTRKKDENNSWRVCGEWEVLSGYKILSAHSLESNNCFMAILVNNKSTQCAFLDLSCKLINIFNLEPGIGVVAADVDQRRKDLILVTSNRLLKSFSIRLVNSYKSGIGERITEFHVILRYQVKLYEHVSSPARQVSYQEVPQTFLVLASSGDISCWDSASLEILWQIDASRFMTTPQRLAVDRFGSDFVVLCAAKTEGVSRLEFWSPPKTFAEGNAQSFQRFEVPLKGSVLSCNLETVGGKYGTLLMVILNNRKAQLYSVTPSSLLPLCQLAFTGAPGAFSSHIREMFRLMDEHTASHVSVLHKSCSVLPGVMCFGGAGGLPGCDFTAFATAGHDYCILSFHFPSTDDVMWQEASEACALMDVDASDTPPVVATPLERLKTPGGTVLDTISTLKSSMDRIDRSDSTIYSCSFFYAPLSLINCLKTDNVASNNRYLQLISPKSLLVLDHPTEQKQVIRKITRNGFSPIYPVEGAWTPPALQVSICNVAYRAGMLVLITSLKEGFAFNLRHTIEEVAPLRMEIEVRPQAYVTTLLVADVFVKLSPEYLVKNGGDDPHIERNGMIGCHTLTMVGDSDGKINFALSSLTAVLHQGTIRAHDAPVSLIVSTGDASRPLWRLNSVFAKEGHLVPATAPGSAIISISESGEMKVWQPLFTISGTSRARHTQLLSIYQLSWRISGLMSMMSSNTIGESGAVSVMSANVDPTCTTLIVGLSDGALTQWPVPGLIDSGDGKVQSGNSNIWMSKKHSFSVDDVRIWTHLPDSSVRDGPNGDWKLSESKDRKYVLVLSNDSRKQSITYTLDDLRRVAEGSSMATCSSDKTLAVWKFLVSKAVIVKDARGYTIPTRHMVPHLCHVLNFSGSPIQGLCYPLIPAQSQHGEKPWRVTCIVGGIVLNAFEGNSVSVFSSQRERDETSSEVRVRNLPKVASKMDMSSSLMNLSADAAELDDRSVSAEDGLPVVCAVHRLQKTVIAMSRQSPVGRLSWEVFALWQTEVQPQQEQHVISLETPAEMLPTIDSVTANPFTDSLADDRVQSAVKAGSPSRELQSLSLTHSSKDRFASPSKHSMSLKAVDVVFGVENNAAEESKGSRVPQMHNVVRAGVRMVVSTSDLDVLNEIAPEDKSKRYTVDKRILTFIRNGDEAMSIPTDPVLSIRPPSPPRSPLKHTVLDGGALDENPRVLMNRSISALTDTAFSQNTFRNSGESQTSSKRDIDSSLSSHTVPADHQPSIMLITDSPPKGEEVSAALSPDQTQHSVILDMSSSQNAFDPENRSLDLKSLDDNSELSSVTPKGTHDMEAFLLDELMSTDNSMNAQKKTLYVSKTRISKSTNGLQKGLRQPYRNANSGYTPGPSVTKYKKSPKRKRYVLNKNSGYMMTAHQPLRIGSPVLMRGCESETELFDVEGTLVSDVPEEERFPEGYYYKLPTPRFVRMSPQEKRRRYRDMQNALRTHSDSDDEELTSYIEFRNPEEHFNAADRSLWGKLDEEARAKFLAQKEAEHKAMMEETHQAFREMTMTEDTESVGSFIDNATEAEVRAPAVTMNKIMGWGKIRAVSLLGITTKRVSQLFADATKTKIDKVSEAEAGLGEFTKFAASLNKLVVEIQAPPEVTIEVANAQHDMVDVYLESNKVATAWVIVMEEGVDPPYPEDFDDVEEYRRRPGIVQVVEKKVPKKKEVEFNIFGLKPKTIYNIYACAQHDKSLEQNVPSRMTDMMILDTHERLVTPDEPPEVLEIEWSVLTDEMQAVEAKAAIYDGAVQETAKIDGLTLPSVEDINHRHTSIKTSPHLKKWQEFVSWWTDDDLQYGFSDVRSDFLFREALYASRDGVTIEECEEAGYLTFDESKLLTSLVVHDDVKKFSDNSLYIRFRSWFKAGRVVERQLYADPKHEKVDEGDITKIKAARLSSRMEYLKERIATVEKCIEFMGTVIDEHKSLAKKNLSINDLEKKRGQLKPEDVTSIMASKKLTDLCALYKVDINAIRPSQWQLLTGIETFVNIDVDELMADEPPQMVMLSLPGTDKRPLKAWAFCSEEEKDIEVRLACMISSVIELAVEAGICVPDIEDINLIHDSAFMPLKYQRFQNFKVWYCGKEGTASKPTEAIPSLQRILFADWEKSAVYSDASMVDELMGAGNYGRKDLFTAIANKYEIEVNAPRGLTLRATFLKRMVKQIGISRRTSMQRLLWPSCGPGRMTSQYLFPRMGIVTPQLEEPAMRFNPYPSTKKESYTVKEILAWYTAADLINEDKAMLRAEAEGRRLQEYMDWLAKEQERRIENRKIMLEEDATSHRLRLHVGTISEKPPTPLGKPRNKFFSFGNNLPGRYDYLQATPTYADGSGINNEDEVADVIDKMRQDAEDAIIAARELKRIAAEERRIKDEEERIRQEKLERDQRIEENKERLKRLRAYLDNLKLEKKAREEAKAQEAERVKKVLEEETKRKTRQKLRQALLAKERNDIIREQELMYAEDVQQLEIRRVLQESSSMEHEDIRGLLMREEYNRKADAIQKRIDDLADIYEEFQPFQFRKSRVRVPGAHLDDENVIDDEDDVLQESLREMSSNRSVKWKMFLKQQPDAGTYYDNETDARIPLMRQHSADVDFKKPLALKNSLSHDHLIGQPLLWRGPSAQAERRYGKLRKRERLYTPTNPDAAALLRDVTSAGIVLPNSALEHELHSLGISNTLMKTMSRGVTSPKPLTGTSPPRTTRKQHSRNGTADMNKPSPLLTHTSSSVSIINKLSSSIPPSPLPAPQSPSQALQDSISSAVLFQPEKSALAVDVRPISPSKAEYALLKSMSKAQNTRRKSELAMASLASIRMQHTANYQRGKGKVSEVIRKVKDERKALRDFIASNTLDDDKFYVEACKPIDRDRPYLDTCRDVIEFRKSLHVEGYEVSSDDTIVEELDKDTKLDDSGIAAVKEIVETEAGVMERMMADDLRSTDRHTVTSAADSDIVSMPDDNTLIMKYSVSIPEEPAYEGAHDMRQHSLPPPFYRKTFGVVGEMKHLCAPSPVFQAKQSSLKDRPTNGDVEKELTLSLSKSTLKSRHSHELTSIKKMVLETKSPSFSATDVNFRCEES